MVKIIKVMCDVIDFILGSQDKRSGEDRRKRKLRKRKNEKRKTNRRK